MTTVRVIAMPTPAFSVPAKDRAPLLRRRMLACTDWIETCAMPGRDCRPWIEFRHRLKDIVNQPGWPHAVIWPDPPRPDPGPRQ